jgi:hypothetical protein
MLRSCGREDEAEDYQKPDDGEQRERADELFA